MADLALNREKTYWDISFKNGDFALTETLDTALLMSLFLDVRADRSEIAEPTKRRGWFGNLLLDYANYQIGSKLWLLEQARLDLNVLNLAKTYVYNSLQWFVEDGFATKIEVDSSFGERGIIIEVALFISQDITQKASFTIWGDLA